jgi:DNA-binding IclR family transcriptional regulator
VVDGQTNAETTSALPSAEDRVARALAEATAPLTVAEIQRACRIRTASICRTLSDLVSEGRIRRTAAGYLLAGR